jgi:hypothetical protein
LGNQKYSKEDYRLWEQLYIEKGLTCQQISSITNVSNSTIKKHLKKQHLKRNDDLYFVVLKHENQYFFKIGRTFYDVQSRCGKYLVQIIGIWKITYQSVVHVEKQVLQKFQQYEYIAPKEISGRTECFLDSLPWMEVLFFIDMAISSLAKDTSLEGSETTGEVQSS